MSITLSFHVASKFTAIFQIYLVKLPGGIRNIHEGEDNLYYHIG